MRLRDSKTGPRMVPMPSAAAEVFRELSRTPNNPWVFPGRKWGAHLSNLNDSWDRIRKHAGLDGVRLLDLRHTYASRALAQGEGLPMIGDLLGHSHVSTTARYAHLDRDAVREASAKIGEDRRRHRRQDHATRPPVARFHAIPLGTNDEHGPIDPRRFSPTPCLSVTRFRLPRRATVRQCPSAISGWRSQYRSRDPSGGGTGAPANTRGSRPAEATTRRVGRGRAVARPRSG